MNLDTLQDDTGVEGVAVNRFPKQKVLKVGKRLAAEKVKMQHHDNKEDHQETYDKMSSQMKVNSIDKDWTSRGVIGVRCEIMES